jgi:hypothetical protein
MEYKGGQPCLILLKNIVLGTFNTLPAYKRGSEDGSDNRIIGKAA